jgi:zinc-binding in reverse transcriptase
MISTKLDGLNQWQSYIVIYRSVKHLAQQGSTACWHWNVNGIFSVHSAYSMIHDSGVCASFLQPEPTWKIKAHTKVKIFFWTLLQDKILTQQTLQHRGVLVQPRCYLFQSLMLEKTDHLFLPMSNHCYILANCATELQHATTVFGAYGLANVA